MLISKALYSSYGKALDKVKEWIKNANQLPWNA